MARAGHVAEADDVRHALDLSAAEDGLEAVSLGDEPGYARHPARRQRRHLARTVAQYATVAALGDVEVQVDVALVGHAAPWLAPSSLDAGRTHHPPSLVGVIGMSSCLGATMLPQGVTEEPQGA